MENKFVIIISGPTATGKTSTSINLAKKFDGEIVNFDSLLFYNELNIGTAKPNSEEQQSIKHHMVSGHSIKSPINAADYIQEAIPIINECHKTNKTVFLVGGSGFYLQATIKGMYKSETTSDEILDRSKELYEREGISPFRDILKLNDPISFDLYHENDHYRIRRAVEHYWMTGIKFSDSRLKMSESMDNSPVEIYGWKVLHIYLDLPKDQHFEIIQKRVSQMINDGLVDEVKNLLQNGATGNEKPLKSIGYKETIGYINGDFESIDSYKERLAINTRRLAKSQRTWFKKQEKLCYNALTDSKQIEQACQDFIASNKNGS
jgi:tRNA dimethylallyltransferase